MIKLVVLAFCVVLSFARLSHGQDVNFTCAPEKATYIQGEPVYLECEFTNKSDAAKEVAFGDFGTEFIDFVSTPPSRANMVFRYALEFPCRDPFSVPPHGKARYLLPLNQWSYFKAGRYRVEARLTLHGQVWEVLKSSFDLQIKQAAEGELKSICRDLIRRHNNEKVPIRRGELSIGMGLTSEQFNETRAVFKSLEMDGQRPN